MYNGSTKYLKQFSAGSAKSNIYQNQSLIMFYNIYSITMAIQNSISEGEITRMYLLIGSDDEITVFNKKPSSRKKSTQKTSFLSLKKKEFQKT